MYAELSLLDLVLHASFVVQFVLLILVLASILSWTTIFDRARVLRKAARAAAEFERRFWSGGDLSALYRCLLYTSPSPRDRTRSRMPSSA